MCLLAVIHLYCGLTGSHLLAQSSAVALGHPVKCVVQSAKCVIHAKRFLRGSVLTDTLPSV